MTNIYGVPLNYSGLKNYIPIDQEIIYSSIFKLSEPSGRGTTYWRSHVILTNKGAHYIKGNGLTYFTDWGHVSGIYNGGFNSRTFHLKVYYDEKFEPKKDFKLRKAEFKDYIHPFYWQRKNEFAQEKYEAKQKKKEEKMQKKQKKLELKQQKKLKRT